MKKARRTPSRPRRHMPVKVIFPETLSPIVVTTKGRRKRPKRKPTNRQLARPKPAVGCLFPTTTPSSVVSGSPGVSICKYSVPGDANATDSVSFKGGARITSISVVPIFYGTAWLTSMPSNDDVMVALRNALQSPYLSQLDQYGVSSLQVQQPVLKLDPSPPAQHSSDEAGNIVWDLIDSNVFPEPDDPGGYQLYMVFFPMGTAVSDISACGWHSRYWDYDFPFDVDWAWVGAVDFPTGGSATSTLDNIIRAFSHELVEMLTDPEADGGWTMDREINAGTEIGDACNNTVDFLKGTLVNAYWSERHKACIIPKPTGFVQLQITNTVTATTQVASGTVHIDRLICLRGDFAWTLSSQSRTLVIVAKAVNFQNPTFSWVIDNAFGGAQTLPNGFSGTVELSSQTWFEDVNGTTVSTAMVPVTVLVNNDTLTVKNVTPGNLFRFLLALHVNVSEGAFMATGTGNFRIDAELFKFEDAYYEALKACRKLLGGLVLEAIPKIPPIDPGDPPPWIWVENLVPWVEGNAIEEVTTGASVAAALQNSNPALAARIRTYTSLVAGVPLSLLTPQRISRGIVGAIAGT